MRNIASDSRQAPPPLRRKRCPFLSIVFAAGGALLTATHGDTHRDFQAVDADGLSAWAGSFPVTMSGVLLCDPDEMLDATPQFLSWNDGANVGRMGGEWQVTFQAVEPGDRGGTTCWLGQNYANRVPPRDDAFSYSNPAWVAEVNRLNHDPQTGRRFRKGDLIRITANRGLFYGGKRNINEAHDVSPEGDFSIELITPDYGLPAPETITLADVVAPDDGDPATAEDLFDPTRGTGGEHWQGMRVRIRGLSLTSPDGWNPAALWPDRRFRVTDGAGRFFTLRHPRYSLGPVPGGRFDAVGIFTQESGSGTQGRTGYELFVQQIIPHDPPVLEAKRTITLSWPATGAVYQLEVREAAGSGDFHAVTNTPVVIEERNTVSLETELPAEFFRLRLRE